MSYKPSFIPNQGFQRRDTICKKTISDIPLTEWLKISSENFKKNQNKEKKHVKSSGFNYDWEADF